MTLTASDVAYPIHLGPPEIFGAVRRLLSMAHYDEPTIAGRIEDVSIVDFKRLCDGRTTLAGPVEDATAALIRLFLDAEPVPREVLDRWLPRDGVEALLALGLLATATAPDALEATVSLYPANGLWVVSDRVALTRAGEAEILPAQDFVFSAGTALTRDFISVLPNARGLRVLEQCAGTGIAALCAARDGATEAWAVDIGARSVHFAKFNALLNDLADRVTVVQSDLWSGLGDETFDLIVAHPPYVPSNVHRHDFRDAGEDGEHVTRRFVEGLGKYLRPGGSCMMRAGLSDRRTGAIQARLRGWLEAAAAEFDLVVVERGEYGRFEAYRSATHGGRDSVDLERWMRFFEANGIESFSVCTVSFRRTAVGRTPITERRKVGSVLNPAAMDWHFRWGRFVADQKGPSELRLAGARPRLVPGVRLAVHLESDRRDASWHTVGAVVETMWPSHVIIKLPALGPTLLELCDGTRDLPALVLGLQGAGLVDANVSIRDVAVLVEPLAAAGVLHIETCPLPLPPASA